MEKRFSLVSSSEKVMNSAPFLHRNASKLGLGFFGLGRGENWHRQITTTAADYHLIDQENRPNPHFPWANLQLITDTYLKKRGQLESLQRDDFLVSLVQKHPAKDIAIASCGHMMSRGTLRHLLLTELRVEARVPDIDTQATYLRLILVINHINPSALSALEVQCATRLLATSSSTISNQTLAGLIQILATGIRTENILFYHVKDLAKQALTIFVGELEKLKVECRWSLAHSAVQWLSMFEPQASEVSTEATAILDDVFPLWRAWAAWRPDMERIFRWDQLFSGDQLATLRPLLSLEGPDYTHSISGTLREAQVLGARHRGTALSSVNYEFSALEPSEVESVITRLMKLIDTVCSTSAADTEMLAYLCIGKWIMHKDLDLLESLTSLADPTISVSLSLYALGMHAAMLRYSSVNETECLSIISYHQQSLSGQTAMGKWEANSEQVAVVQIYRARYINQDAEASALETLLPLLNDSRCFELRALCGPKIASIINETLQERRLALQTQLRLHRPWTGAEIKLQAYGAMLISVEWLWSLIENDSLEALLEDWPSVNDLNNLHSIRTAIQTSAGYAGGTGMLLLGMINDYYLEILVKCGTMDVNLKTTVKALVNLWKRTTDRNRRSLALLVSEGRGVVSSTRSTSWQFINELPDLDIDLVRRFQTILNSYQQSGDAACVDLAALLGSNFASHQLINYWRPILYRMARERGTNLVGYALNRFTVHEWIEWLANLRSALGGDILWNQNSPPILNPDLHRWSHRLYTYLPAIASLEKDLELGYARQCFLLGGGQALQKTLEQILSILSFDLNSETQTAAHAIIPLLTKNGDNASNILDALTALTRATDDGVSACLQLIQLNKENSAEVAEVVLAGWLQATSLTDADEIALELMAALIGVQPGIRGGWSNDSLKVVADYVDTQYALLVEEANRLDAMRMALKKKDPVGMTEFLAGIGIEDVPAVEAALADLPPHLINVVEKVGEREVEILFPLTNFTQLQRAAIGIENAQSIVIRLIVGGDGIPPGFCIHLDTELKGKGVSGVDSSYFNAHKASVGSHSPWMSFPEDGHPDAPICHGKVIPAKYQLARLLNRHLFADVDGLKSLEAVHDLIANALKGMGKLCITCGSAHDVNLRRSTVCQARWCNEAFLNASLEVRLSDIRSDPAAVDLLLTMVFAAATLSNRLELLPGCPFNSTATVLQVLNKLPSMVALQNCKHFDSTITALGPQAVQLLTWVCTCYKGFLTSATGSLKIPSMPPGTHQFILANASPEKESSFLAHINRDPTTRLLFHGTSPDRLFAILCQGLQIKSNTPLQTWGAADGAGIYMAEEPKTSWEYTNRIRLTGNWPKSTLSNFRVLLGCENAGPAAGGSRMHVIRDPSTVMVRYIFLIPASTPTMPIRNHLDSAMLSVFRGLRSGAL